MLLRLRLPTYMSILFVLALAIRIGAVVVLRDYHAGPSPAFGADPVEFDSLARHLAAGEGYVDEAGRPTSFRAPGFPIFLAGFYSLFGTNYPLIYLTLCVLGAFSCVLTYFVARELLDETSARVAAALSTVYFPHIYFSTLLLSENLFILVLCVALWLFLRHMRTRGLTSIVIAGLCLGVCILTRPFALLLVPVLAGVLLINLWSDKRAALGRLVALAVATVIVVAPWTIRNDRVHNQLVLVATNGGSTFYGGNNEIVAAKTRAIGTWVSTRKLTGRELIDATPNEVAHDKLEWQLGRAWLREHPSQVPLLMTAKVARLLLPDVDSSNRKYVLLNLVGYTPYLLLMLVGIARCLLHRQLRSIKWIVIHGTMLATIATALIFWGSPRFRDANLPVLMVYCAAGVCRLSKRAEPLA